MPKDVFVVMNDKDEYFASDANGSRWVKSRTFANEMDYMQTADHVVYRHGGHVIYIDKEGLHHGN